MAHPHGLSNAAVGLQILQGPKVGGVEAAVAGVEASAGTAASAVAWRRRIADSMEATQEAFGRALERAGPARDAVAARQQEMLQQGRSALTKLAADGERAQVTHDELRALEAVVIADGSRPSLFVQDNAVDNSVPQAGTWKELIGTMQAGISTVARSVGRISLGAAGAVKGTAFCVGPGLVLTNRHVLQAIADQSATGAWVLRSAEVIIDFAGERQRTATNPFRISGVAHAPPAAIDFFQFDFAKLDMALLTVDPASSAKPLPPPLPLLRNMESVRAGANIFALGFPAEPAPGVEPDDVLRTVFQDEFNVKRFAPGNVMVSADDLDDGGHHRVFTHNASTLGGNSGSCVVEFSSTGNGVVGLHFGGFRRERNFAHAIAKLEDVLGEHGVELQ